MAQDVSDPEVDPEDAEEFPSVVIDNGSHMMKGGFTGDDAPRTVFPSIVGRPRHVHVGLIGMAQKDAYVGDEAASKRGVLVLHYPIKHGCITNWDNMQKIWHHMFYNELRVQPEEQCVLLSRSIVSTPLQSEKMTQIMFETFNVPGMYVEYENVLALYASGRVTGFGVNLGDNMKVVPIYQGHAFKQAARWLHIGGSNITDCLMKLLNERGYDLTTGHERQIVRDIKEKLGYVAADFAEAFRESVYNAESGKKIEREYELPDGQVITIGNERFRCVEPLFSPSYIGLSVLGLAPLMLESMAQIRELDQQCTQRMWSNIVLSGGSSMFEGVQQRLEQELTQRDIHNVRVIAPPHRKYSVWIGGSIFSTMSGFENQWVSKDDYDEVGPTRITVSCF